MRFLLVFLLLLAAPFASAQAADTLWAHGTVDADGNEVIWMNFDADDPAADDNAAGPGYTCGFTTLPPLGEPLCILGDLACIVTTELVGGCLAAWPTDSPSESFDTTFTMVATPALEEDVVLDPDGQITFTVYFGANSGTASGSFDATLRSGDNLIAEVLGVPLAFDHGYVAHAAKGAVQEAVLAAGEPLTWEIHATGDATGLFMGIHPETGRTAIALPLASALPPKPTALSGDGARIFLEATNATTAEHLYTWQATAGEVPVAYDLQVAQGEVRITLTDADGATLFNDPYTGDFSDAFNLTGTPGTWNVTVALTDFIGSVDFTFKPVVAAPSPSASATPSASTSPSATGDDASEDSPVGLWSAALAFAVVVVLQRRRL